jgi:hypothetical protein
LDRFVALENLHTEVDINQNFSQRECRLLWVEEA